MDAVVTRLHRCLVDAIRQRGEEPDSRPFKVSEVYQDLVPYREVRSSLGVELNADYEHALLRLLGGEGDLIRLEPESARAELRREVESPYPFVGMYRKYSANDVYVHDVTDADAPAAEAARAEAPAAPAPAEGPGPAREAAPARPSGYGDPPQAHARHEHPHVQTPVRDPVPRTTEERRPPGERVVSTAAECAFCDQALPVGRRVRYCPWCGSDQKLRPCPRCDEVLDRVWRFCINCGLEVPVLAAPRPPDPDE